MWIKRLYRVGNSHAVILPADLLRHLGPIGEGYVTFRIDHLNQVILGKLEDYLAHRPPARADFPRPDRTAAAPASPDHPGT